jgi:hypothetical protein
VTPALADMLVVRPVLDWLGAPFASREARCMLLAIGTQESGFAERDQSDPATEGPALGFWQFERIAVADFFVRGDVRLRAAVEALRADLPQRFDATWRAIGQGADHLACVLARDMLWRVPQPLPTIGDIDAAWFYYTRAWRPGMPHRVRWNDSYAQALARLA